MLLVVAVFALGCVLGYLWGKPPERRSSSGSSTDDTIRATRSRARTTVRGTRRLRLEIACSRASSEKGITSATAVAHEMVVVLLVSSHTRS